YDFLKTIPTIREVTALSTTLWMIEFRNPTPPFDRPQVRYALSVALNRSELIDAALRGHGRPAHGITWPDSDQSDRALSDYPFESAEARRILLSNGVTVSKDGLLEW